MTKQLLLMIGMVGIAMGAQTEEPAFDVTSVKKLDGRPTAFASGCTPNGYASRGFTIRTAFLFAYDLKPYQVTQLPSWFDTAFFDIEARSDNPVDREQCKRMLRRLLVDRFALRLHSTSQTMWVYALVVDKSGIKTARVAESDKGLGVDYVMNGSPMRMLGGVTPVGWTMPQLADIVRVNISITGDDTPVVDHTGLEGLYKIHLHFEALPPGAKAQTGDPTIFEALPKQMGLRLERRREPVEVFVIDRLELPSAN